MYIKFFSGTVVGVSAIILLLIVLINVASLRSLQSQFESSSLVAEHERVEFSMDIINRFATALRFETVSHDDAVDRVAHEALRNLHAHIFASYPIVHKHLRVDVISNHSLVYTWEGKNKNLLPVLLCAHLDVVPAKEEDGWKYPPFSGTVVNGYIWGRGALDDKHMVFAILEAAEHLLKLGFQPDRTIYFAFGHDEEIGGKKGAQHISQYFTNASVKFDWILDEGLAIIEGQLPGLSVPAALIGTEEKGNLVVRLRASGAPGHGSMPPKQSVIGNLARAIAAIEAHPMPPALAPSTREMFQYLAPEMNFPMKVVLSNMWLFEKILLWVLDRAPASSATISTTRSVSMINGGVKVNVVAPEAVAYVDIRIAPHHTVQKVVDDITNLVKPFNVTVETVSKLEPSPKASITGEGFRRIATAVKKFYPHVPVAPALMIGNTDTQHYWNLSTNIYRFAAVHCTPEDLKSIHGLNEKISYKNYINLINFYVQLMKEL